MRLTCSKQTVMILKWIRTTAHRISDEEVLAMSVLENRIFRFKIVSSMKAAIFVTNVLNQRNEWQGMFSVVSEDKIRMRPLP